MVPTIIQINDMNAVYVTDDEGHVSFCLVPASFGEPKWDKGGADPADQISVTGDASGLGFNAGQTRHNSGLTMSMRYVSQDIDESSEGIRIVTHFEGDGGIKADHIVSSKKSSRAISVCTKLINDSNEDVMIEAVSSLNLSCLTPYADDEATGRLSLHRFRSRWSGEGRHEENTIEDLMLEPSWARFGTRCEKFGNTGSMPVRGYFPFAAVEDKGVGVLWGITLACSSSWQIEAVRNDENLSITAALADFEYGHWRKKLTPKEEFTTPECFLTTVVGTLDDICDRLLDAQRSVPSSKRNTGSLPLLFNEYCTTWGEPSEENIDGILNVIKDRGYEYFVIDAGWYADEVCGWQDNMGDWCVSEKLFANGIGNVVEKINCAGMKAGIWFELEVVGKDSYALTDHAPHLLTRDGKVIVSGTRRFWDMRSKWVNDYLSVKVIDFLKENGFEYIKIDYNDTIGIGCDGSDSYGEGLRCVVEATKKFFAKIREEVPDIAIEICSSGGHRLEPSFMALADYLSFSDAHEEKEIPVIAADLQRLILPSKSQIWSVLRKDDSPERLVYSICAGMYGVLCISGDVHDLSDEQWTLVQEGTDFYKSVTPIIADGITKRFGPFQISNRRLQGYQASARYGSNGGALVIVHSFEHEGILNIDIPLEKGYKVTGIYETGDHDITVTGSHIHLKFERSFDAVAIRLK